MVPYTEIGRTEGSVTMRAFGATTYELVEHAAVAMFSVGYDVGSIAPTYSRPLVAPGDTLADLLGNWLRELRLLGADEGIVWSQVTVDRLEAGGVQGSAAGRYQHEVTRSGPAAVGVLDMGPIVEVPEGFWIDVTFATNSGLRVV